MESIRNEYRTPSNLGTLRQEDTRRVFSCELEEPFTLSVLRFKLPQFEWYDNRRASE